jgi:hypothetical protein
MNKWTCVLAPTTCWVKDVKFTRSNSYSIVKSIWWNPVIHFESCIENLICERYLFIALHRYRFFFYKLKVCVNSAITWASLCHFYNSPDKCYFFSRLKFFFLNSFIHTCMHCLGHFSPSPRPPLPHFPPQFQAGPVLPLSLILLKKREKHNKEDKVFLLVELRIAIQKYS